MVIFYILIGLLIWFAFGVFNVFILLKYQYPQYKKLGCNEMENVQVLFFLGIIGTLVTLVIRFSTFTRQFENPFYKGDK